MDPDFVKEIIDYDLLVKINCRREVDRRVPDFTKEQKRILHKGIRCTYAPNDPGSLGKNKCVNDNCPGIKDLPSFHMVRPWKGCNPNVTKEYIDLWTIDKEAQKAYGNPELPRKYYLVDMISDEEMSRFVSDPTNAGRDFQPPPSPEYQPIIKKQFKINPITGRKMYIVGYEPLTYPDEDGMYPIWDYVDEIEEDESEYIIRKAKKIEKKKNIKKIINNNQKEASEDEDYAYKEDYEKSVNKSIKREIKLTEVEQGTIQDSNLVVILDNPAEVSFVSETLQKSGIDHCLGENGGVVLVTANEYTDYADRKYVLISNTVIQKGCQPNNVKAWKILSDKQELEKLIISDRDYYEIQFKGGTRWTCRNMYGITHICIYIEDMIDIANLDDGLYPVSVEDDDGEYNILMKNGEVIGKMSTAFIDMLKELDDREEIISMPEKMKGIFLQVKEHDISVLGMGKLKYYEY